MRNLRRKHGRTPGSGMSSDAPYRIKDGFDEREIMSPSELNASNRSGRGKAGDNKRPGKLQGFIICHNQVSVGGYGHPIAYDQMAKLGKYDEKSIREAMRQQLKAEPGKLIPNGLHVYIPNDARRVGDHWEYPGTYSEQFQWHNHGLKCSGDGQTAHRRQDDGTLKKMDCVPVGSPGKKDGECCPMSVKGDCKCKARIIFRLFHLDSDGEPQPLCDRFDWSATYRLDTTSEYAQLNILEELDRAADALNGKISGITGLLYFSLQEKRYVDRDGKNKPGKVGQIRLSLDSSQIERRASGEADRILAGAYHEREESGVAGPVRDLKHNKDLPPQPEREERQERGSVQELADTPAPDQPETAPAAERDPFEDSTPPEPADLDAMSGDGLVSLVRDFVGWRASRSDASEAEVQADLVFFTIEGTAHYPLEHEGWAYFEDGQNPNHDKRVGVLRSQIAPRILGQEDFAAFWTQREEVRS